MGGKVEACIIILTHRIEERRGVAGRCARGGDDDDWSRCRCGQQLFIYCVFFFFFLSKRSDRSEKMVELDRFVWDTPNARDW